MADLGRLYFMRTAGGLTHRNALRKKIERVAVTQLRFLDDHGLLTDLVRSGEDWRRGGTKFVDKQGGAHWRWDGESHPASVTKGTRLTLEVDLQVGSADADPIDCIVKAVATLRAGDSGAPKAFTFTATTILGGQPTIRLRLSAEEPLADQVFLADDWALDWTVEAAGRTFIAGQTGPHRLYVTFGTPNPATQTETTPFGTVIAPPLEAGITDKRMNAAITLTEDMWRTSIPIIEANRNVDLDKKEPHDLAWAMNCAVQGYTLQADASVPAQFRQPTYLNQDAGPWQGGAWPLTAYREQRAECQAIVRLLRAMILQIGMPGQADYVVVYAHENVNRGTTALVDSVVPTDPDPAKYRFDPKRQAMMLQAGLSRDFLRVGMVNGQPTEQVLSLAAERVAVGMTLNPGDVFNTFEACLRYTQGGKTYYYGGGIVGERFDSPEAVLRFSFWGLVWHSHVQVNGVNQRRVDEIVATYK